MSGKHEDEQDVPDDGSVIQRDDSTVASSAQDAGWRRAVSIHAVLSVTAITGIVMTVTFAELLGETSCDAGLEDTRASMQRATDMQFSSSVDALDGITRDLLGYSQIGMHGMVKSFLQECLQEMNGMAVTLETFVQDQNKTEDWMQPALPALWHQTAMLLPDSAVYALGIYSNIHGRSYYQTPNGPMMLSFNDDFPERNMYATVRSDGSGIPLAKFSDLNSSVSGLYTTKLVTYDFVRFGDTRFSNIVPVGQDVGMVVVQKFRDGTGTFPYLATSAFVQLSKIEAYIRNIVSSDDNTTHATPRVFLVVARSWLAEALRDANDPEWEKMDQSGYLTAVSHGTSTEQVEGPSSLQGGVTNLTYPILASRASDPYISAIAVALEGNYSRCEGKHLPVMLEVDGGQEEHFVGAQRVELNEGLEWWLVMSLDSMSIFGSVRKAQDEMNVLIAEDVSEVADTIERNRISARIVVCAVGASIGLLILYVSFVVVRPIKNLQVKMQRVAGMDLAGLSLEATSLFSEVRSMQVDFRRMVENLVEYRAYVPSSILDGSSPTAKRRRDLDPPTGCIAVVFTDIKGSTELWRLSPSDMNVAMEHHNDEIRAACGAHSGYEVKTIGDSFMVSFSEPLRAALFTMEVLARFAKRKWPAGLMLPDAGLVLRIGVNCGPTIAETNPVTGRVDYRGGTVNLASRVEGKARPGTVCMTADFYAAVKADVATLNVSVLDVGVQEVKGLGAGYQLYLMVPDTLKCRFDDADTDCVLRRRASTVGFQNEVVHESPPGSVAETTSSGSVPVVHHNTKKELRGKTALQVARSGVTVAVCRLKEVRSDTKMFDNCNIAVRSAIEAAQATGGMVGNVTGRSLQVVWNASKKCVMHSTAALSFAQEMSCLKNMIMLGLGTGTMLHGNVGTRTSRFPTIFGQPIEAAEAMTDHAKMFGVYCLYADCSQDNRLQSESTVRSCVRMVDVWMDATHHRKTRIYEVCLTRLQNAIQGWAGVITSEPTQQTDLEHHTRVIEAAMEGEDGHEGMLNLVKQHPDDKVLRRVLDMIEHSKPMGGVRCRVNFTRVPVAADYESIGGCVE